jgi:hypothetical protein
MVTLTSLRPRRCPAPRLRPTQRSTTPSHAPRRTPSLTLPRCASKPGERRTSSPGAPSCGTGRGFPVHDDLCRGQRAPQRSLTLRGYPDEHPPTRTAPTLDTCWTGTSRPVVASSTCRAVNLGRATPPPLPDYERRRTRPLKAPRTGARCPCCAPPQDFNARTPAAGALLAVPPYFRWESGARQTTSRLAGAHALGQGPDCNFQRCRV